MTGQVTWATIGRRLARLCGLCLLTGGRMAVIVITTRRSKRAGRLTIELVRMIEELGGAFIKAGQVVATRVDLVGPAVAGELNRLHDHVAPMTAVEAIGTVRHALGPLSDDLVDALARPPVASGSIASVYRVRLADRTVALKVRRPDVGATIAADLAIIRWLGKAVTRTPAFRRVPIVEIADQIGRCLIGQLDFAAEADSLRQMKEHLAAVSGVHVPAVIPELCGDGVIAMEFVDGLTHASIERLPAAVREAEVAVLVRAVYHLLFAAGFVHVDLHQGNTYFRSDGTVVLLDAGFTYELSREASRSFTAFFGGMIQGEGEACADVLYATARGTTSPAATREFRTGIADLVERNTGSRVQDFNLSLFCVELFDLQRRCGLFAEAEFIFPMLCLLSLEGLVKEHHPTMDFQIEAAPYVMQSLLTEPPDEPQRVASP
ncbi:ABC1 kinase family protein [Actinoallomurus soli]|uniref:ABC1 kinase family protein n=1 Tax=Actinoallomurus soli TaxID=2952535 RepID=UPI002093E466|nr:AarF/ABC1/UbiB kinase family protein [Actinoallomurus soli]MCO5972508.1 AarF/ABC1/UbiB kinase family protein [Actinoallomurus soli]